MPAARKPVANKKVKESAMDELLRKLRVATRVQVSLQKSIQRGFKVLGQFHTLKEHDKHMFPSSKKRKACRSKRGGGSHSGAGFDEEEDEGGGGEGEDDECHGSEKEDDGQGEEVSQREDDEGDEDEGRGGGGQGEHADLGGEETEDDDEQGEWSQGEHDQLGGAGKQGSQLEGGEEENEEEDDEEEEEEEGGKGSDAEAKGKGEGSQLEGGEEEDDEEEEEEGGEGGGYEGEKEGQQGKRKFQGGVEEEVQKQQPKRMKMAGKDEVEEETQRSVRVRQASPAKIQHDARAKAALDRKHFLKLTRQRPAAAEEEDGGQEESSGGGSTDIEEGSDNVRASEDVLKNAIGTSGGEEGSDNVRAAQDVLKNSLGPSSGGQDKGVTTAHTQHIAQGKVHKQRSFGKANDLKRIVKPNRAPAYVLGQAEVKLSRAPAVVESNVVYQVEGVYIQELKIVDYRRNCFENPCASGYLVVSAMVEMPSSVAEAYMVSASGRQHTLNIISRHHATGMVTAKLDDWWQRKKVSPFQPSFPNSVLNAEQSLTLTCTGLQQCEEVQEAAGGLQKRLVMLAARLQGYTSSRLHRKGRLWPGMKAGGQRWQPITGLAPLSRNNRLSLYLDGFHRRGEEGG